MITQFIVFAVICTTISYSQLEDGNSQCRKIPPVRNVNHNRLLGTWYAQEVGAPTEAAKECLAYTNYLKIDDDGKAWININSTWKEGGELKSREIRAFFIKNSSASKIVWENSFRFGWLISTDYKYTTWYICLPNHPEKGIVFINTKENNPSQSTMEKARESVKKIGFDTTKSPTYKVNRSKC